MPRPKSTQQRESYNIRLEPSLKEALHVQAIREGRHFSDVVEEAASDYLKKKSETIAKAS